MVSYLFCETKAYTNLAESAVTMNTCKEFSFPYVHIELGTSKARSLLLSHLSSSEF